MEKKTYESPEIRVVELEVCQMIATSGPFPEDNVSIDLDSHNDDNLPGLGSDGYFRAD